MRKPLSRWARVTQIIWIALLAAALGSCRPNRTAAVLPLLAPGQHLGMIVGFEPLPVATATAVQQAWDEALGQGLSVGRIHLDWADLEPDQGQYDQNTLLSALLALQQDGLQSFVGIYAIDTDEHLFPADLAGREMDDPEVLRRYAKLLGWAVPLIVAHGGFVLSVGNEPDDYLEQDPARVGRVARFTQAARVATYAIDPRLAVTITLTANATRASYGPPVIAATDVAAYNVYPLDLSLMRLTETGPGPVAAMLGGLVASSGGRQVVIQELGCPSGPDGQPSLTGSSQARQAEFVRSVLAAIRAEPKIRVAVWFQLTDWSIALTDQIYGDFFRAQGLPAWWIAGFEEWLTTSGFLRYAAGSERSGWNDFLVALAALRDDRASAP